MDFRGDDPFVVEVPFVSIIFYKRTPGNHFFFSLATLHTRLSEVLPQIGSLLADKDPIIRTTTVETLAALSEISKIIYLPFIFAILWARADMD